MLGVEARKEMRERVGKNSFELGCVNKCHMSRGYIFEIFRDYNEKAF